MPKRVISGTPIRRPEGLRGSVSPGSYAIQAYHDENDNLTVDRNFLGLPNEAIGFSNNAPMRFGPPHFEDAEVIIPPEGILTALQLHSIWP